MPHTAALIGSLIREDPLCLKCLAAKSGVELMPLEHGLVLLEQAMRLHRRTAQCSGCGTTTNVVSFDRRGKGKSHRLFAERRGAVAR
jgi:hypothetical protein